MKVRHLISMMIERGPEALDNSDLSTRVGGEVLKNALHLQLHHSGKTAKRVYSTTVSEFFACKHLRAADEKEMRETYTRIIPIGAAHQEIFSCSYDGERKSSDQTKKDPVSDCSYSFTIFVFLFARVYQFHSFLYLLHSSALLLLPTDD